MKSYKGAEIINKVIEELMNFTPDEQPYLMVWETESRPKGGVQHEGMRYSSSMVNYVDGKHVRRIFCCNLDSYKIGVDVPNIRELQVYWSENKTFQPKNLMGLEERSLY